MATARKLPNVVTDAIYKTQKFVDPVTDIKDLVLDFNLDKETTGVNDVATNGDTCSLLLQVSIDGPLFFVGSLPTGAKAKVLIKLSAERADAEIPYAVTYTGTEVTTVTTVAAA